MAVNRCDNRWTVSQVRIPIQSGHPFRHESGHPFRYQSGHPFRFESGHTYG